MIDKYFYNIWRVFVTSISCCIFILQMIIGILLGFIVFPFGIKNNFGRKVLHNYNYTLLNFDIRHIPGVKFNLKNSYSENFTKPAIIVCNHQSTLDSVCMMILSPKIIIVANNVVWHNKIIHCMFKLADFYPMSKGLDGGVEYFKNFVKKGYSIAIFPEGERSQDCSIMRFHRGAFYVARQLNLDILPVFIHGVGHVMPKSAKWVNKGQINIEIEKRFAADDAPYQQKTKNVHAFYVEHFKKIRKEKESALYFKNYVNGLYASKGNGTRRRLYDFCLKHNFFSEWIDAEILAEKPVVIINDVFGVIGVLFALTHYSNKIYSSNLELNFFADIKNLPQNLHFCTPKNIDADILENAQVFMFKPLPMQTKLYAKYAPKIIL